MDRGISPSGTSEPVREDVENAAFHVRWAWCEDEHVIARRVSVHCASEERRHLSARNDVGRAIKPLDRITTTRNACGPERIDVCFMD